MVSEKIIFLYLPTQNNVKNEIEDNDEIKCSRFRDTTHKTDLTVDNIRRDQPQALE